MPQTTHSTGTVAYTALALIESKLAEITPAAWKTGTALFAKPRSVELTAVDQELERWHAKRAEGPGTNPGAFHEALGVRAVVLHYALENWKKRDRADRDPVKRSPDGWKSSKRNARGTITQLDQILRQYTLMTTRYAHAKLPDSDTQLLQWQREQYEAQFVSLFRGARMVPKNSFLREIAAGAGAYVLDKSGALDRAQSAASGVASTVQSHVVSAANTVANSDVGRFAVQVGEWVKNEFGRAVDSHIIQAAIHACGIAEAAFVGFLDKAAHAVIHFIASIPGISLVGDIASAGKAFYTALSAHIKHRAARRARYVVTGGTVRESYDKISEFWAEECKDALKEGAVSLASAVVKGVCMAVSAGASAIIEGVVNVGTKIYAAAKKIWDMISAVLDVVKEITGVNEGLAGLTGRNEESLAKKLFELSPLLACYFFMCIETGHIVMLDNQLVSLSGFVEVFDSMRRQVEPVQEKAAKFIAESKFMIVRANGKMLPARAVVDKTVMAQIKDAISDKIGDMKDDLVDTYVTSPLTDAATSYVNNISPGLIPTSDS